MVTLRLPREGEYEGFQEVRDFIGQADFRFGNLETTAHNFESPAGARSGGSWLCSPPGVVNDLGRFGINILSTANNHALDYGQDGLLRTIHSIEQAEIPFAGTGRNLADASRPAYLDTPGCRYALIACTMSFHPECMAGAQTAGLPGRPGVNGIHVKTTYRLPREEMAHLKRIADELEINTSDDIIRGEGYLPQLKPGQQPFGRQFMFEESDRAETVLQIDPADGKRIRDAIAEARFMADCVVVAMHTHTLAGKSKETVDQASIDFSHLCIDSGADAVIGTGPHLLRPMEIYRGKPIFYCLGDFINQLETILRAPAEMFAEQELDGSGRLDELFNRRSDNGRRGLCYDPIMFKSVIPYWEAENGELSRLVFMPVEEQFGIHRSRAGWPRKDCSLGIIEHFAEMCRPFGIEIRNGNGMGIVKL